MWRRLGLACIVVGLCSCGGGSVKGPVGPSGADTFVQGSRLKARWLQAPDAPRQLVGWYDGAMGFNCAFSTAYYDISIPQPDGGDFYCLPALTSGTGALFADAQCTQLVADVPCERQLVQLPSTSRACDAVDRIFPAGDAISA